MDLLNMTETHGEIWDEEDDEWARNATETHISTNQAIAQFKRCKSTSSSHRYLIHSSCRHPNSTTSSLLFHVPDMAHAECRGISLASLALTSRHFIHDDEGAHNQEVEQGVAEGLIRTLHKTLILHQVSGKNYYRNCLSNMQGLHIAVLSSSLAMVLRCSKELLAAHVHKFQSDLINSLQHITEIFVPWAGNDTIQEVALSSTARTIRFIIPHVPYAAAEPLVDILMSILHGHLSSDIRIDAASALVSFFENPRVKTSPQVLRKMQDNASLLISTLSTASLANAEDSNTQQDPMIGLYQLAAVLSVVRVKMVKRRCTILAICKHLTHPDKKIRKEALYFCKDALSRGSECLEGLTTGLGDNVEILTEGLIDSAATEVNAELLLNIIMLLERIVSMDQFPAQPALEALRSLAYNNKEGVDDSVMMEAACAYCRGTQHVEFSILKMATIVDLTTSGFAQVRSEALTRIEAVESEDSEAALQLLEETDMLENLALIIRHGSNQDCAASLDISRQLARSSYYHRALCSHSGFLGAVVELVAKEQVHNRIAHFYGVETILALLSKEGNTKSFLAYPQLLPWLVTFVNRTTADEDFKQEVVVAIVRISTAMLE
jgi:hypothetical protein